MGGVECNCLCKRSSLCCRFVINLLVTNLVTTTLVASALCGEHAGSEEARGVWVVCGDAAATACSLAGLLDVLLIALDQHHAVTDPLRCHTRLLQRRPASLCAAVALVAALAAAVKASLAAYTLSEPQLLAPRVVAVTFASLYLVAGVLTPALLVCGVYGRIYRAARSSGVRARACGASALQLHEPAPDLPDLAEEDGLALRIDVPLPPRAADAETGKAGAFLLPPERPRRCPSAASLRVAARRDGRSTEDLRRLPAVSSAPSLAAPLLTVQPRPTTGGSRIASIRCRISNASLFRYREESRAARVGLLTGTLVLLHVPHAVSAVLSTLDVGWADSVRTPSLALLLLSSAACPFLFALRSRRVQREARRLLLPEKSLWGARSADAAAEGARARVALDLLRTLSPGATCGIPGSSQDAARASFSSGASGQSGASTQLSSTSEE